MVHEALKFKLCLESSYRRLRDQVGFGFMVVYTHYPKGENTRVGAFYTEKSSDRLRSLFIQTVEAAIEKVLSVSSKPVIPINCAEQLVN